MDSPNTKNQNINATSNPLNKNNAVTEDVKWNDAPTLLEQQRENLTARLRREFGLCISDDDDDKSNPGENGK